MTRVARHGGLVKICAGPHPSTSPASIVLIFYLDVFYKVSTVQFHTKVNPTLAQGTLVTLALAQNFDKNSQQIDLKNHQK